MVELAKQQPGFLGIESVKEKLGISVSYWKDLASIGTIMLNMLMQGKKEEKIGIRNFMFELQKLRGNIVLQKKSKN